MILTLDIGNSEIMLGGFDGDALSFVAHIGTDTKKTSDEYAASIISVLALYSVERESITGAIISSVVPSLNPTVKSAISLLFSIEPLMVGPGIKTGIGIRCDIPSSVGADLISASVAAHYIYGSPSLIIDIGTATKMTVVDKNGAFIGTSIIPGVLMGLDALSKSSALLPNIEPDAPGAVIAKNTADCMRSGIIYGNASMIDGMIDRIRAEIGDDLPLIVTGSQSGLITPHLSHKFTYDEHLVLRGLNILYKKNN
jgi:type III pantothenate kinase